MKKALRYLRNGILILLGILVLSSLIMFCCHRYLLHKERTLLQTEGYEHRVSVGDYSLNLCTYGSETPKHTLVGISGLGMHQYALTLRNVTDGLADENRIVIVERAGYGMSDDSREPQTVACIVEQMRTALKNAGIEAPYVLLPHSIGGVYATWWVSTYPDEIEGIVFFDGTAVTEQTVIEGFDNGLSDWIGVGIFRLGWQRLVYPLLDAEQFNFSTEETRAIDEALTFRNYWSAAQCSETKRMNANIQFVYENMVTTTVPKVYICSSNGDTEIEQIREKMTRIYDRMVKQGVKNGLPDLSDEALAEMLEKMEEYRKAGIYPYIERLGNCRIVLSGGNHHIYWDKPELCYQTVQELLAELEE